MAVTIAPAYAPLPDRNFDPGALITFAAQGAGTSTTPRLQNFGGLGVKLVIDITAINAAALTVTIEGVDVASGKVYTLLASAALAATGTTVLTVYPAQPVTANISANDHLPAQWDVKAVITGTSVTATIGCSILH